MINLITMQKENNNYFKRALSDFAYDMACGAQIRHLTDLGYTAAQIMGELDIFVPFEKVRKTATEHLRKTGILLLERPDIVSPLKTTFIKEYDRYGRPSFRRVVEKEADTSAVCWQEHIYFPDETEGIRSFLNRKTEENGEELSYISCDFGLDEQKTAESMSVLEKCQREYIAGILWENLRMYHRLTPRMKEIISRLYEQGLYEGEGYFKKSGEHIIFSSHS